MRKTNVLLAAAVFALAVTFTGCPDVAPTLTSRARFTVVPYGSAAFHAAAAATGAQAAASGNDGHLLVYAVRDDVAGTDHYLFYLGFVQDVPIVFEQAVSFNGGTAMSVSYTRTTGTEQRITDSMQQMSQHVIGGGVTVTTGLEVETSVGFPLVASATMTASVSTAINLTYGFTTSTTNTVETSMAMMESESFTISATVGNRNELPGIYRLALFGVTDVFYMVRVDSVSREIQASEIVYSARPDSLAWGLDFVPFGANFSRTGSAQITVPVLDFNYIAEPGEGTSSLMNKTWTTTIVALPWPHLDSATPGNNTHIDRLRADFDLNALIALGYERIEASVNTALTVNRAGLTAGGGFIPLPGLLQVGLFPTHNDSPDLQYAPAWQNFTLTRTVQGTPSVQSPVGVLSNRSSISLANFGAANQEFTVMWLANGAEVVMRSRTITLTAVR